jgi:hypothetical protein
VIDSGAVGAGQLVSPFVKEANEGGPYRG